MSPGVRAQIRPEWRYCYRAPGTPMAGVVQQVSPTGTVACIRFDHVADSYVLVSHLEPAAVDLGLEAQVLSAV